MRNKFLRTNLLTGRSMQMRYLILLMVSMLVPVIFVGGCLYYIIFTLVAEQLGIPESIAYNLFPVIKKINMILLIGVPPLLIILMLWGIKLSHRFAGPLERLEKEIEKISHSRDYTKRIHLRKDDDIKPVADAMNKLLDNVEGERR